MKCAKINIDQRVDFVMSGDEALELVKTAEINDMRYCLILTDISMP